MSKRGPDGIFHPLPMSVPSQIVWAPAEITPPVISIDDMHILDFGRLPEANPVFSPVLYSYANNFMGQVGPNEAIRYSLQIVSDKFISKNYQVFEVAWDGNWGDSKEKMKNHLTIREIES